MRGQRRGGESRREMVRPGLKDAVSFFPDARMHPRRGTEGEKELTSRTVT